MNAAAAKWAVAAAIVIGTAILATAAPAPVASTRGDKWEYCEIQVNQKSKAVAKANWGPAVPRPAQPALTWVTAEEVVEAATWQEMATTMKVAPPKKDVTEASHKLRVLNHMGTQGWELVTITKNGTSVTSPEAWTFKRRAK